MFGLNYGLELRDNGSVHVLKSKVHNSTPRPLHYKALTPVHSDFGSGLLHNIAFTWFVPIDRSFIPR